MSAPVAGESNLPLQNSDSAEDDFTISQLTKSETSLPNSPPPPSSTSVLGKRRKSMPVRYIDYTSVLEKKYSPLKPNFVNTDPSSNCLSSPEKDSATKCLKSPVSSSAAMIRAEEIRSSLGTEHPSCVKLMVKAHVSDGYWMGFPQPFKKMFLPNIDSEMIIEDENGGINHVKYIAYMSGLSAGWKKFAKGHNLLEGDVLVFRLVEPLKFKVYIIRANDLNKADGALSLYKEQTIPETDTPSTTTKKSKRRNSLPLTALQKKQRLATPPLNSGNDSEDIGSEVLEGSRPSKANLPSQELKTFQDFHIMVKGQCIDSELPEDVRMHYYKLCIGQKELLHDCLPEGLYDKLVAGMIGETVNIANAIKNCKLTTTKEEFGVWDKSLKSFEMLGMKVGFLCDRIHTLSRFVLESESRFDLQRYNEANNEKKRIEDEIKDVMQKLVGLKESCGKLDAIVGGLKEKVGRHEAKFQEEVDAPW